MSYIITMRNADGTHYLSGDDSWTTDIFEARHFEQEGGATMEVNTIRNQPNYGNGDYGVWNAKVIEAEPSLRVVSKWREDGEDEGYGGSYTIYRIAEVPKGLTDEQIEELVDERYPQERCQHEYDCCGNYYTQGANWSRTTLYSYRAFETLLIVQGFYQNV